MYPNHVDNFRRAWVLPNAHQLDKGTWAEFVEACFEGLDAEHYVVAMCIDHEHLDSRQLMWRGRLLAGSTNVILALMKVPLEVAFDSEEFNAHSLVGHSHAVLTANLAMMHQRLCLDLFASHGTWTSMRCIDREHEDRYPSMPVLGRSTIPQEFEGLAAARVLTMHNRWTEATRQLQLI